MISRIAKLLFLIGSLLLAAFFFEGGFEPGAVFHESGKSEGELVIRMLDVGQGDAILLEKDGKFALIDSGDVTARPKMKAYLEKYHVKNMESVVITHPHADHIGGMLMVFAKADIKQIYDNGDPISSYIYHTYQKVIENNHIPRRVLQGKDKVELLPGVPFEVVGPLQKSKERNTGSRQNNNSIVGRLKYKGFTMLFTGDAEAEEENSILESGADIKSIVLKVGHHGSKTSTTKKFLDAVSPREAFISCGAGNSYGHPNRSVLARIEKAGSRVYRTDRDGTITLRTDGKRYQIEKEH